MKILKTLTAGALLLATAGLSNAQVTIRIVASNGDRIATQTAIAHILGASGTWTYQGINGDTSGIGPSATVSSVATGANYGAWSGTFSGTSVIIKTSYAGALAGIAAVASNPKIPQRFVVSNGTGTGSVPNPSTLPGTLGVTYELGEADFAFSTNFQSTSPFNGEYNGHQYDEVVQEVVGVSPLGFYASPGFPGDNITTQQAQLLYTSGAVSLALFTGTWTGGVDGLGDKNRIVWAIGRNTDAGQRFGAYGEIGLGGIGTAVRVWKPTIAGATTTSGITYGATATSHILWPAETVSGIFSDEGSGGYNAGAELAPILTVHLGPDAYKGRYLDEESEVQYLYPNALGGYYIGYLTSADGNPRVLGIHAVTEVDQGIIPAEYRGKKLKYNGVEFTNANVQTGKYTAWLYNRIIKPTSGLEGLKLNFANQLRDQIRDIDATTSGLFNDSTFKVKRSTDGGLVLPK